MRIPYYPGCTLKTTAKNFEDSAVAAARVLDMELWELPRWNCCGTVYSLAKDNLMEQLAPIRNLLRVKEQGETEVATLCSMCYNTLKQANLLVQNDSEKREKIRQFMDREKVEYNGEVKVFHLLELLSKKIGFEAISKKIKRPLNKLKIAPYYGCLLLRPKEVGLDDAEEPEILDKLIKAMGGETVDYPYKVECCGSYQAVNRKDVVLERTWQILSSAEKRGADAVIVSCPLCFFNLDTFQKRVKEKYADFKEIPIFYFTQLLAFALGIDENLKFDLHSVDTKPVINRIGR
ncbi:MAG: CoB--CoM heterodisulfide reductase iron-sulfur subunit B family protein [bacterium]